MCQARPNHNPSLQYFDVACSCFMLPPYPTLGAELTVSSTLHADVGDLLLYPFALCPHQSGARLLLFLVP